MMGSIKTLTGKGFGFIAPEDGSKDIFFHATSLQDQSVRFDSLQVGQKVAFEIENSDKGPKAINVTLA